MSGHARKPTLWTLRKVSNRISLSLPRKNTFRPPVDFLVQESLLYTSTTPGSIHYAESMMLAVSWATKDPSVNCFSEVS